MWSRIRLILGWCIFLFVVLAAIYLAPGGWVNLKFFLNFEAMLVFFGGTFVWGWMTFGFKLMFKAIFVGLKVASPPSPRIQDGAASESPPLAGKGGLPTDEVGDEGRARTVLSGLRNTALAVGMAGTILGIILMLGTIDDIAQVPKKMAIELPAAFFGILLAEVFFSSLLAKVTTAGETIPSQRGYIYSFLLIVLLGFFIILYALSAALNIDVQEAQQVIREIIEKK